MGKHNNKYYRSEQDDDEDDGKPSGGGFWENLLPWNWDFGGILMGLALLVGGYFLLRNEKVQEAIGKFMGKDAQDMVHGLVENIDLFVGGSTNNGALGHKLEAMNADDAKKFLTDQKMDETVVNTLTATTDTWQDFIKTVEEANGGKLSKPGQFTSPDNA